MEFINLKKIASRLAIALILFQICNTYLLYINFKENQSASRMDRLKVATIEGIYSKTRQELKQIVAQYSLWHLYVIKKTKDGYELLRSSASAEEVASSSRAILSDSMINKALSSGENPHIVKFKSGFSNIEAMIYSLSTDESELIAVAEVKLYENFLFSEAFIKALGQAIISFLIVIFFFVYIYLSFKKSTKEASKIVQDSQESLENSKKSREFILNSISDMVVVLDKSGRIVEVNDAFLKQGNYKKADVLNTLFLNYVDDEFLSDMKLMVYGQKGDRINQIAEIAIKNHHNGILSHCVMQLLPFEIDDKEYTYLILKDITELKSTKRKLQKLNNEMFDKIKESTNYSRFILDSEPNIIWVQNREVIVDANKAFFDFFCNSNRDLEEFNKTHKSVFEMFEVVDRPDYIYDFERKDTLAFLLTNRHKSYKASFIRGGRRYIFKTNANYIMGGSSTNFVNDLFIVILTDITESEMIKDKEINLVRSSTIGKLAAGITHEINTPVTYMKGNFELLKEELKDRENMDFEFVTGLTDSIQDGLSRVEGIVRSMKELNVKSTDNLEKIDIIDSIITAINMVQVRAKYLAKIYVNKAPSSEASKLQGRYFAYASMQKLEQVWIIVLNNALDEFSKSDMEYESRRIDIDISKDEFFVNVYVRDNAGGIPESIIDNIFDPMFSTKTSSGMGLGLNITKKIMESLKGSIIAYNDNNGAVFEINIPIIK
ncbi:MAG: ATP-binding protein [Campylobacterales bacterium]